MIYNPNKADDYKTLVNSRASGETIWASAYYTTTTKENNALKCEPVKGILSHTRRQATFERENPTVEHVRYFVPYGRKSLNRFMKHGNDCH